MKERDAKYHMIWAHGALIKMGCISSSPCLAEPVRTLPDPGESAQKGPKRVTKKGRKPYKPYQRVWGSRGQDPRGLEVKTPRGLEVLPTKWTISDTPFGGVGQDWSDSGTSGEKGWKGCNPTMECAPMGPSSIRGLRPVSSRVTKCPDPSRP